MEHVYTVANKTTDKRGNLKADLLEDGIAIATVRRTAGTKTFAPEFSAKFYTHAASNRFCAFCDSISINEGLEAMVGYAS